MTSCAAKSRRDGGKGMSESDSATKKNIENDHTRQLCISNFFSVTQCYHLLMSYETVVEQQRNAKYLQQRHLNI